MKEGCYTDGEPKVRYRGIFVNDEGPCTSTWVKNSFGEHHLFVDRKSFRYPILLVAKK